METRERVVIVGFVQQPVQTIRGLGFEAHAWPYLRNQARFLVHFTTLYTTLEEWLIPLAKFTNKYCSCTEYNVIFSFHSNEKFPI